MFYHSHDSHDSHLLRECMLVHKCENNYWPIIKSVYLETSGSHWAVRLGHSKAWVITRSYRKGVFFFQILYSSFITLSSTASSNAPAERAQRVMTGPVMNVWSTAISALQQTLARYVKSIHWLRMLDNKYYGNCYCIPVMAGSNTTLHTIGMSSKRIWS